MMWSRLGDPSAAFGPARLRRASLAAGGPHPPAATGPGPALDAPVRLRARVPCRRPGLRCGGRSQSRVGAPLCAMGCAGSKPSAAEEKRRSSAFDKQLIEAVRVRRRAAQGEAHA